MVMFVPGIVKPPPKGGVTPSSAYLCSNPVKSKGSFPPLPLYGKTSSWYLAKFTSPRTPRPLLSPLKSSVISDPAILTLIVAGNS